MALNVTTTGDAALPPVVGCNPNGDKALPTSVVRVGERPIAPAPQASRGNVFIGYAIGAVLVIVAAAIAWRWAVNAERKPLEEVAPPLGVAAPPDRHDAAAPAH
jgi:hypothetical protein